MTEDHVMDVRVTQRRIDILNRDRLPKETTMSLQALVGAADDAVEVIHDFIYFGTGRQVLYKVIGYDEESAALRMKLISNAPETA